MIRHVPGTPGHDVWITCESCGGVWLGQPFDNCEWCEEAKRDLTSSDITALLFPEWLGWGERYWECNPASREVWATTRGFVPAFEVHWLRRVRLAKTEGVISGTQLAQAMSRYRKWKATQTMPSSTSYEKSNG